MANGIRLWVVTFVLAVHGAALGTVHVSMVDFSEQEKLAVERPARVVVTDSRAARSPLATSSCPAPTTL